MTGILADWEHPNSFLSIKHTLPETNIITPENGWLEYFLVTRFHLGRQTAYFQVRKEVKSSTHDHDRDGWKIPPFSSQSACCDRELTRV